MEVTSQKSRKSRVPFFSRRSSSIGSNFSFKSVGSTFSFSSANSGSKDENFFESKVNFESDADEEFHSVLGDSTPSETATPNNNNGGTASSKLGKSTSVALIISTRGKGTAHSGDQKVKLIDLLKEEQESIRQEQEIESLKIFKIEKLSSIAGRESSGDETPTRPKIMRNRSFRSVPCCAPCLAFNSCVKERRKAKTDTGA